MKSNNIKVVARFRPLIDIELDLTDSQSSSVTFQNDTTVLLQESSMNPQTFTFDKIFLPSATQAEIFDFVGKGKIEDVMSGYNGTIFAYGQTGSGKTHTMMGSDIYEAETRGLIPRGVSLIFETINSHTLEIEFTLKCSMLEIYKEELQDLLNRNNKKLKIKQDARRGIYVEGLSHSYVTSEREIMELISTGTSNRIVACTRMNTQSSRSHTLFMLEVAQRSPNGSEKRGILNLVDLAGSEKVNKAGVKGEGLEEAKKINSSLSELGNVIHALIKKHEHIPYRNSKLTRLLQESLGGNYKTTLVVNCSPHSRNIEETRSSLKFANRAKDIKNKVVANIRKSTEELLSTIELLKSQLAAAHKEINRLKSINQALSPSLSEEDLEQSEYNSNLIDEILVLKQEKSEYQAKVNELQKDLDRERKKRLMAEEKALSYYEQYNKLKYIHDSSTKADRASDQEKEALSQQVDLLESYLNALNTKYTKKLKSIHFSIDNDAWDLLSFEDLDLKIEIPIYTEDASLCGDNIPDEHTVGVYSSPEELLKKDIYMKNVFQSLEEASKLSSDLQIFSLKKQVILAGIVNADISKQYFNLYWKFNLLKEKFKLKQKAEKSLKENISILENIIDKMHTSHKEIVSLASSLNEESNKSRIIKPLMAEMTKFLKRGITTVNQHTRAGNDSSQFAIKKLELSLYLQTLHNQDLKNAYSILKEDRDTLKLLLNTFEASVLESYTHEKDKWRKYIDKYNKVNQDELLRRQTEVQHLNRLLGKWMHMYMDSEETKSTSKKPIGNLLLLSSETEKSLRKIKSCCPRNPLESSPGRPNFTALGKSSGDTMPVNEDTS